MRFLGEGFMKNVFIGGVSRSGKSTLSQKLYHKLGYSVFELDTIVHSFTKIFPELGISEKDKEHLDQNFAPFAYEMLKCCDKDRKYGNIKVVINGFQLSPKTIANFELVDNMIVIYLGMNGVSAEEMLKNLKETQTEGDWTLKYSDEQLLKTCQKLIDRSNIIEEQCKEFGFLYFDTSTNREAVLEKIFQFLKDNN